jgi:flagellar biosynthetic protein FliR
VVPRTAKVLTCAVLSACLLPTAVAADQPALPSTWLPFALALASELLIGLVLGFFALLAYTSVQVAGELLSEQMGFAMSKVADPSFDAEMAVVARLASVLGTLLFVAVDGHHWLLAALGRSFARLPVGTYVFDAPMMEQIATAFVRMYESGIVLAAPVMVVTLLITLAVGVVARLVPQINALMLSFPLKIGLGLLMLGASMPFIIRAAEQQLMSMTRNLAPFVAGP